MTRNRSLVAHIGLFLLGALAAGAMGCEGGGGGNSFYFVGRAYDGVTGERLSSYTLELQYFDETKKAKVDPTGRYVVGALPEGNDFTIAINAAGYRVFQSHNPMLMVEDFEEVAKLEKISGEQRTLYFDAYLFPSDLQAAAVSFNVVLEDSLQKPNGQMRLRPADRSMFYDNMTETPAGVGTQVWMNDEDLQSDVVDLTVTDGAASCEEGRLVYGVTYTVNVYGIPEYDALTSTFLAGVASQKLLTMDKNASIAPLLLYNSSASGAPTYSAEVSLVFNAPIEFDASYTGYAEAIDDGLTINSPDFDGDTFRNVLQVDASSTAQEKGTSIQINGNVLTLSWDQTVGLANTDPDDPINYITFYNLDDIHLRPVGGDEADSFTLSSAVGATWARVRFVPTNVAP